MLGSAVSMIVTRALTNVERHRQARIAAVFDYIVEHRTRHGDSNAVTDLLPMKREKPMPALIAALPPLLSTVFFALGAAVAPPATAQSASATAACSLLTKDLVVEFTPYEKKALDLVMRIPPSGDPVGRSGSECTYGGITLQVDPFPPATIEKQRDQSWQAVKGVGDVAYFRDNGGRWGELYVKAGSRVVTLQMDVPTGRTAASLQPNLVGLAKALLSRLK